MLYNVIREEGASFDPAAISAITAAYHAVIRELGLSESNDAGTRMVAKRITRFASQGQLDPGQLKTATLKSFEWIVASPTGAGKARG